MIKLFASVLPIALFTNFINVGEMVSDGPNSPSTSNGGEPPIDQQNPSIIQQMATNAALNNPSLGPSEEGNQPTPAITHQPQMGHGKTANKKAVKVGRKVKLQQKLKSGVKSKDLGGKKSKLGLLRKLGLVLCVYAVHFVRATSANKCDAPFIFNKVKYLKCIKKGYDNHAVPIEQQFVSCQPSTNPVGQKCEFIVEQMELNKNMPNVSMWANLDGDNEIIQQLGHKNINDCETDGDDDHSYCDTKFVISADQIDQLPKLPAGNIHQNTVIQINKIVQNKQPVCPPGYVLFNYINACNYPLHVTATSREYPSDTTLVKANQQLPVCAQAVMSSGRVWASTDCAVQDSCVAAQPPVSLFEMTFNPDGSQFMDVSYVDGINVPIGVHISNCQQGQDQTVTFDQQAVEYLRQMFPHMAVTDNASGQTKVKSVCGHYNTPNVCCQNEFSGGPNVCGPGKSGWTTDQTNAYKAFTAVSANSYAFAYDDGRATVKCNGATAVNIGFCKNP